MAVWVTVVELTVDVAEAVEVDMELPEVYMKGVGECIVRYGQGRGAYKGAECVYGAGTGKRNGYDDSDIADLNILNAKKKRRQIRV